MSVFSLEDQSHFQIPPSFFLGPGFRAFVARGSFGSIGFFPVLCRLGLARPLNLYCVYVTVLAQQLVLASVLPSHVLPVVFP